MTRTERAYVFTKQRVLDATFAGGDLLTEGEVADALGMSRTPVREAFLRVQGEGLLRLYPKRGALVVPVSAQEVDAVMETRLLVERFAFAKVVERGADVTGAMRAAIARQEEAAGDLDAVVDDWARRLAAGPPLALSMTKTMLNNAFAVSMDQALEDESRCQTVNFGTADTAEAMAAFVQKREPRFTGK